MRCMAMGLRSALRSRPLGALQVKPSCCRILTLGGAGWTVPAEVPDSYLLRVYDTRIDPQWLGSLAQDLTGVSRS